MSRIVAPTEILENQEQTNMQMAAHIVSTTIHMVSHPIRSLTRFAAAFSALIHDVDHRGVPNPTLAKENPSLARQYRGRSVAEQNSFDLPCYLLMTDRYTAFRVMLCPNGTTLRRFRQLVVNCVMSTDIMDPELKVLRNNRWDKAFKEQDTTVMVLGGGEESRVSVNRKATIVIEHLIQASDVAHTMQHWHVYRKWNQRLFQEMHRAFREGRAETNPADNWYESELGFLDYYVIPLAKKLKDCGVFGVSSDEYLNYAMKNRKEWEEKGKSVVTEMVESVVGVDSL